MDTTEAPPRRTAKIGAKKNTTDLDLNLDHALDALCEIHSTCKAVEKRLDAFMSEHDPDDVDTYNHWESETGLLMDMEWRREKAVTTLVAAHAAYETAYEAYHVPPDQRGVKASAFSRQNENGGKKPNARTKQ
jgi:hypothetical protein